jgi:hypothetical protein
MTPHEWATWLGDNGRGLIVPVGAVLTVVFAVVLVWQLRHRGLARVGRAVAMPLVLAWEAQGLHQVAIAAHSSGVTAWVFACVTSVVLITLAAMADEHHRRYGSLGWPGRLVWVVAAPMGLVVSFTSRSVAEVGLRLILPLLAALVWWTKFAPPVLAESDEGVQRRRRSGSWRWTPRRIGVRLGLLEAAARDLEHFDHEHRVRQLTSVAHKFHHGARLLRGRRAARLRRLGLLADDHMIREVQRRVARVHDIERATAPDAAPRHDTHPRPAAHPPAPLVAGAGTVNGHGIEHANGHTLAALLPSAAGAAGRNGTAAGNPNTAANGKAGRAVAVPTARRSAELPRAAANPRELSQRMYTPTVDMIRTALRGGDQVSQTTVRDWVEARTAERGERWRPSEGWAKGVLRQARDPHDRGTAGPPADGYAALVSRDR